MMQQQQQTSPLMAPNPTMYPHPSTGPSVRRLYYRHQWFKLGFGGLVLSAVLFFVGFLAPGWSGYSGLWMKCYGGNCYGNVGHGPDWFDATRSMEVLALVCFLGSVGMELYQDVFKSPPPRDNKTVEILGVIAGVLGLIGVIICGASPRKYKYYWDPGYAFGLATAGLVLCIPSSVLMWVSRERHAMLTYHALVSLGVQVEMPGASHPAGHPAYPMHSFAPPPPPGYPYPVPGYPYPYPYASPYPYPYPAVPTMMAPGPVGPGSLTAGQGMTATTPVTGAQGMPTSQVPTCFVAVQGQMVPVYGETPLMNTATTANMASAPADERPAQ